MIDLEKSSATKTQWSSMLEESPCPLCQSSNFEVLQNSNYDESLTKEQILKVYHSSSDTTLLDQLVRCKSCSLVHLNPRVKKDIILESYKSAHDEVFVKQNELRYRTFKRSFSKILKMLNIKPGKNIKVLDVGCAGGAFLRAARDLGCSTVGVEPSKWMCEFGKKEYGLDLRPGILSEHNFKEGEFDIITLWDVIEHIVDPETELRSIYKLLKPGGSLIVNYPNFDSVARRVFGKKWPFFLNVHLYYFTPKTMGQLLKKIGYQTKFSKPFWQTLELGYIMDRATPYLPVVKGFKKAVSSLGMDNLPFTYNLGQTLLVAKRP